MAQRPRSRFVLTRTVGSRARVGLKHTGRNPNASGRRRIARPVSGGRHAERATEARCERTDAREADVEADVRDRTVGVAKQLGGALEPSREEVLVRRLAERPPELSAEVCGREASCARECRHIERLSIAGVDQVLGAEQVAGRRDGRDHPSQYCCGSAPAAPTPTAEGRPLLRAPPQQLTLFEAAAGAEHHAFEWRVRDDDGQSGLRAEQPIEAA